MPPPRRHCNPRSSDIVLICRCKSVTIEVLTRVARSEQSNVPRARQTLRIRNLNSGALEPFLETWGSGGSGLSEPAYSVDLACVGVWSVVPLEFGRSWCRLLARLFPRWHCGDQLIFFKQWEVSREKKKSQHLIRIRSRCVVYWDNSKAIQECQVSVRSR